ncbi:MAG: hypothetical protein UY40_C0022G0017 [candidate division CPR1 bacterium GW2011_GWC1_49_13]|uniref:Bacterial Ig-like domain-containing protein n=1 Tax=candidate division CPR1 bacterium GW2011_GWC1_49_13 TaxID=1618342 RepID=A0A0G1XS09_9BACT|nr:MAG: hypothetical protein UY40_C0022G0017 [candidate division CPR1 bacterium GW2011_GWC1_49_13]
MNHWKKYNVVRKRNLQKSWRSLSRQDRNEFLSFLKVLGAIVAIVATVYYVGINGLTHIGGFWAIFTGEKGTVAGDTQAPPPPTFSPLNPYTKQKTLTISGYAEPSAEVKIMINGSDAGTAIAEAGGTFSFKDASLKEGKNVITATAKDLAGNESQKSAELIVTLDTKTPKLAISSPKNGQKITGEKNQVNVLGKTDPGVTVRVNSIQARVLGDGSFSTTLTNLPSGETKITIIATDKAGNQEKIELTVTYSAE